MYLSSPLDYVDPVFRPPSEANSLLLQVTLGCSNNQCTYCDMYRSKKYQVRPLADILKEIKVCSQYYDSIGRHPDKMFLCDGDALGAPMELLSSILEEIRLSFLQVRRVGVYATAGNILRKTEDELRYLASKNLEIAYLGLESGDDQVLKMVLKGHTAAEMLEASLKIKRCGFKLSTIAMLGLGGRKLSREHVVNTAKIISETSPQFFSMLTTIAVPGTPYQRMVEKGLIEPLTSRELLQEMYDIIELINLAKSSVIFRANHVSNMHPIAGVLPKDKLKILANLRSWIEHTPEGIYPVFPNEM